MPILLGISILRLIREGSGCASACLRNSRRLRDAGVLPGPTAGQQRRNQAEKMRVGSNAQVPANWPFLRIPAQSQQYKRKTLSKQPKHHGDSIQHKQLAAAQGSSLSPLTKKGSISLYSRIFTVAFLGGLPCAIARNACSDCATITRARSFLWIEWNLDGMAQCSSGMTSPRTPGVLELPRITAGRYSPRKSNLTDSTAFSFSPIIFAYFIPASGSAPVAVMTPHTRAPPALAARQKACV